MFLIDIASGQVDLNDTKRIEVTPKDGNGNPTTPDTLVLTIRSPDTTAEDTVYNKTDFTVVNGVYHIRHKFDMTGMWYLHVAATDSVGNTENESHNLRVS